MVVWLAKRGGDAFLLRPEDIAPMVFATNAWDPVIAASLNPQGPVAIAWESTEGDYRTLRLAMVRP